MKVAFHSVSLAPGGVERVLACMVNYWTEKGWQVILLTHDDGSLPSFFKLDQSVTRVAMNNVSPYSGLLRALGRHIGRIYRLRRELRACQPECVISFGEINGIRAVLATVGLPIPIIIYQAVEPSAILVEKNGWIWAVLRWLFYPLADAVVVLTPRNKEYFSSRMQKNMVFIPNPVPDDFDYDAAPAECPSIQGPTILAMGRFVEQKRFDLLLRAFAQVADKQTAYLVIVGDGPLREELEALTRDLGLVNRVSFPGYVQEPWARYKHSRMFVMSSEREGFPMVLVEALASGIPVVSFDCPTGPREIVRHGIDGILVPPLDTQALAQAILQLLEDPGERDRMAAHTVEVKERFSMDKIMAEWEELITSILPRRKRRTCA